MLYSVRGKLLLKEQSMVVVECGGVGYKCFTTFATLSKLPERGSEVMLYTYMHLREDACDLFGFYDIEELNCFKMLISVSGVGPKAGLAILSELTPQKFALCVVSGDSKTLTRAQGVGPKLAQRIVLELKDKIEKSAISAGLTDMPSFVTEGSGNQAEALSALLVLGYSQSEAIQALAKIDSTLSVEELIKQGLKALARKV